MKQRIMNYNICVQNLQLFVFVIFSEVNTVQIVPKKVIFGQGECPRWFLADPYLLHYRQTKCNV